MTAVYEVKIYDQNGVFQENLTGKSGQGEPNTQAGWTSLSYVKGVNMIGSGMFTIHADSAIVALLDPNGVTLFDAQIEFWRSDPENGIAPYADFYGFLRDREYSTDDNGNVEFIAILAEQQDYLRRAIVAYRADIANRSLFEAVAAETAMKTLVTRNLTTSGTTGDGRDRNVDAFGAFVTVVADGAEGANVTISCSDRNLFDILREVAELGGLDFGLTKTGALAWEFWTDTRMGDDHTADVKFSLLHGNMRRPKLRSNRRAERTVAIVGGKTTGTGREIQVRTGANYHATTNSYEMFVNGSEFTDSAGLQSAGDARLEELRAREFLSFDVIQVPSTLYGRHYRVGDTVSALFRGFEYTPKLMQVSIDVRNRGEQPSEQIQVVLADD
jgi:hypothetical protein